MTPACAACQPAEHLCEKAMSKNIAPEIGNAADENITDLVTPGPDLDGTILLAVDRMRRHHSHVRPIASAVPPNRLRLHGDAENTFNIAELLPLLQHSDLDLCHSV